MLTKILIINSKAKYTVCGEELLLPRGNANFNKDRVTAVSHAKPHLNCLVYPKPKY